MVERKDESDKGWKMEIQKRAGEAQRKLLKSNREIDGNVPTYAERHKKERWKKRVFFRSARTVFPTRNPLRDRRSC
jgi:hypothetical protein